MTDILLSGKFISIVHSVSQLKAMQSKILLDCYCRSVSPTCITKIDQLTIYASVEQVDVICHIYPISFQFYWMCVSMKR